MSIFIFFWPLLSFLKCFFKCFSFLSKGFCLSFRLGFFWLILRELNKAYFVTMSSILRMILLEFASISFPGKVWIINIWYNFICKLSSNMLVMCIETFCWDSAAICHFVFRLNLYKRFNIWINLDISFVFWFFITSTINILSCNYSNFDGILIRFNLDCLLNIITSLLISPKALNIMFFKRSRSFFDFTWHLLNKTNHCFIALCIKFSIVTCFQFRKFSHPIFCRIFRNRWFHWIFKVAYKP